ncbi:MAG: hypothetical protein JSV19_13515 [Phycisphaerales bacterium]|nr:MAG: hypothetical protein JSV19_13515 [Phycisphaerales bacterium]
MAIDRGAWHAGPVLAITWAAALAVRGAGAAQEPVPTVTLDRELTAVRQKLAALVDDDDLVDSLYFGWFDRPYRRATLACALKTAAVLERELRLRRAGNGALSDSQVRDLIAWTDAAVARACRPAERAGLLPHRISVGLDGAAARGGLPVALFGFVDRATSTRLDDWHGDLDLLASCGFRVYARCARPYIASQAWQSLRGHAPALGMSVAVVESAKREAPSAGMPLRVRTATLRELFEFDPVADARTDATVAVVEPAGGEGWGESFARRGLYRGVTSRTVSVVCGWAVPGAEPDRAASAEQARAAMWAHVCDGQQLGLIEGWRDLRDGSLSPHASVAVAPGFVEAVAHAGLDILHHREALRRFGADRRLLLLVDASAIDADEPNRWANGFAVVARALHTRQIQFDVLPRRFANDQRRLADYELAIDVHTPTDEDAPRITPGDVYRRGVAVDEPPTVGESFVQWVSRLLDASAGGLRVRVLAPDGHLEKHVHARCVRGEGGTLRLALINLRPHARRVVPSLGPGWSLGRAVDLINSTRLSNLSQGVNLAAWQVRLFTVDGKGPARTAR